MLCVKQGSRYHPRPRPVVIYVLFLAVALSVVPNIANACPDDEDIKWVDLPYLPYPEGETTAGILKDSAGNPLLIVVGHSDTDEGSAATLVLDINSGKWSRKAPRLHISHHMAGATVGNKFYLIGGYEDGAPGKLQIYDPVKDTWTHGAKCLVSSGAGCGTALGNYIYYCAGIKYGNQNGGKPTNACARYSVASNKWTRIASMPNAVHHPVMATDGKKLYVFGGRNSTGNNALKPVDFVQVYNPASNSWVASNQPGGPKPLPVPRGGVGNAVFLDGYFYVIGGETRCKYYGPCPNPKTGLTELGSYARIDRYDPVADSWYLTTPGMAIPRHGAYPGVGPAPACDGGKPVVYVCGGGIQQGLNDTTYCQYMVVNSKPASKNLTSSSTAVKAPPPVSTEGYKSSAAVEAPPPFSTVGYNNSAAVEASPPQYSNVNSTKLENEPPLPPTA